ncbi:hypothetical protein Ga0466249_000383 [Sporomusaceae bacterium BoRhaA]|uniref:hypothetical protein n=1 Tax=Pelorhabdus rhamnosifermentans TaxID=2772457 RepID=UPI001C05F611|nr:hypothetical protein [Pelorhabdus rhamnosifermentans]MBU2699304.1 hypothetical protein [Pelorhabdus rhamnosifermentans]
MSQTQLNRFAVISKVIDRHLTVAEAAVSLGISQRQVIRLKKGVLVSPDISNSLFSPLGISIFLRCVGIDNIFSIILPPFKKLLFELLVIRYEIFRQREIFHKIINFRFSSLYATH